MGKRLINLRRWVKFLILTNILSLAFYLYRESYEVSRYNKCKTENEYLTKQLCKHNTQVQAVNDAYINEHFLKENKLQLTKYKPTNKKP